MGVLHPDSVQSTTSDISEPQERVAGKEYGGVSTSPDDQKANKGIRNGESKKTKIKWSDVVRGKSSTDGKISTNRTYDSKGVEYVRI